VPRTTDGKQLEHAQSRGAQGVQRRADERYVYICVCMCVICIIIISVVSVVSQYKCVYYCDTCYILMGNNWNTLSTTERKICKDVLTRGMPYVIRDRVIY
jgi:hypothetical protein